MHPGAVVGRSHPTRNDEQNIMGWPRRSRAKRELLYRSTSDALLQTGPNEPFDNHCMMEPHHISPRRPLIVLHSRN